ncbi:MAG: helicase RepA family protein [Dehalococcoidia bacterium]|nr:helicase RepA family protein [Dehalococcoidia bacterium]
MSREALNQLPAVEWLVDGILPVGGLGVLYGPSGGGRHSRRSRWLSPSARALRGWGGGPFRAGWCTSPPRGRSGLRARVEALEAHNGLPAGELHVLAEAVQFSRTDEVEDLVTAIRTQLPDDPSLIVVDTLARCLVGGDENLARDVGLFVAGLDRLREKFGCSILVVHHSGKGRDSSYRGSSALVGAADSVIRFEGSGGLLTLGCEKLKDGEAFATINAQLLATGDSCVVVPSAPKSPAAPATLTLVATAASLGSDWIPRADLAKASGLPSSTFQKALLGAVRLELLEQDGEGRSKRFRVKLAEGDGMISPLSGHILAVSHSLPPSIGGKVSNGRGAQENW